MLFSLLSFLLISNLYLLIKFLKLKKDMELIFSYHKLTHKIIEENKSSSNNEIEAINKTIKNIQLDHQSLHNCVSKNSVEAARFADEVSKFISLTVSILTKKEQPKPNLLLDNKNLN